MGTNNGLGDRHLVYEITLGGKKHTGKWTISPVPAGLDTDYKRAYLLDGYGGIITIAKNRLKAVGCLTVTGIKMGYHCAYQGAEVIMLHAPKGFERRRGTLIDKPTGLTTARVKWAGESGFSGTVNMRDLVLVV